MEATVTREYKIICPEKYCGDDKESCPQLLQYCFNTKFCCGLYTIHGEPKKLTGYECIERCKECKEEVKRILGTETT